MYVAAASQISLQNPMLEDWLIEPIIYDLGYHRVIEADYSKFIAPMAARRMSPIVKRAIATSLDALAKAEIANPDAIIAGTGLGCVENTEKFLSAMVFNGEQLLQPTHFIQSTHNTISSQIALLLKCNGYNSTYVHRGISFESALFDAFLQFELKQIENALVGGFDELTPDYYKLLNKINFWKGDAYAGEGSTSFVFTKTKTEKSLCKISKVAIFNKSQSIDKELFDCCRNQKIDALVLGKSGDMRWDKTYDTFAKMCGTKIPQFTFKNICGEYFTASAFGLYAAIHYLRKNNFSNILFYNHFQNTDHALIFIEKC